MASRKVSELTPGDFPGIAASSTDDFHEWIRALEESSATFLSSLWFFVPALLIQTLRYFLPEASWVMPLFALLTLAGVVFLWIKQTPQNRRVKALQAKLGISDLQLRAAMQRNAKQ